MAGWFGSGGNAAFTQMVERATTSSLEDIELNLDITDLIRSKEVQPKEAMKTLKRRLDNKNPNVQLAALNLIDSCVKNGGTHFLTEIASREFMDNLVSLLKSSITAQINRDVNSKILELIQIWAVATETKSNLSYINETYRGLQREGFQFPPRVEIASSMVDSNAPPEWTDSDVCMRCRTAFSFTNRKHHCRNCGNVFDQQCSSKSIPLPHLGIKTPVRVDDGCYAKLASDTPSLEATRDTLYSQSPHVHSDRRRTSMQPREARIEENFDEDIRRALAMSLEEVKNHSSSGFVPQAKLPKQSKPKSKPKEEEEDDELKAAIAASLLDMEEQKKKHANALKERNSAAQSATESRATIAKKSDYELSHIEEENINLFSSAVERLKHQPPGAVLREPHLQELYEGIIKLTPKVARSYGETMSKHETLLDLHAKLSNVVRLYDRMLEDRFTRSYANHSAYGYSQHSVNGYPAPYTRATMAENFYSGKPTYPTAEQSGYGAPYQSQYGMPAQPAESNLSQPYPDLNLPPPTQYQAAPQQQPAQQPLQQQYTGQSQYQTPQRQVSVSTKPPSLYAPSQPAMSPVSEIAPYHGAPSDSSMPSQPPGSMMSSQTLPPMPQQQQYNQMQAPQQHPTQQQYPSSIPPTIAGPDGSPQNFYTQPYIRQPQQQPQSQNYPTQSQNYAAEIQSMPAAPQRGFNMQPQQPKLVEDLIEL